MTEKEAIEILAVYILQIEHSLAEEECDEYGEEERAEAKRKDEQTLDSLNTAIKALEEIQKYREIGTVEECREARELQKPKKPKKMLRHRGGVEIHRCPNCDSHYQTDNRYTITDSYCPVCGKLLDSAFRHYCGNCGQALQNGI